MSCLRQDRIRFSSIYVSMEGRGPPAGLALLLSPLNQSIVPGKGFARCAAIRLSPDITAINQNRSLYHQSANIKLDTYMKTVTDENACKLVALFTFKTLSSPVWVPVKLAALALSFVRRTALGASGFTGSALFPDMVLADAAAADVLCGSQAPALGSSDPDSTLVSKLHP